jgi:D-alanyl-D-alanine carboxypeptidase/D-alanyl-D-alanine-endopeptidase (penicillin-binding protein 4)
MRRIGQLVALILCFAGYYSVGQAQSVNKRKIRKLFKHSQLMNAHFTGFALYDIGRQQPVYELNADKYFTPASNTKLLTFYTCLNMLGDSIPALQYVTHSDSLIFWGTGDPSFLHPVLKGIAALSFLANSSKQLCWANGRYTGKYFGPGWAWDDDNEDYQSEITGLPLYGNVAQLYADAGGRLSIKPAGLEIYLKCDSNYHPAAFMVTRNHDDNTFTYPAMPVPEGFRQEIPWKTSTALTLSLLQDTLKKPITLVQMPVPANASTIYNSKADSVYRLMLQNSDNFMAEQLLLTCSAMRFGVLSPDSVIRYALQNYLADLPDKPRWVDGSGLSRYNLVTPRDVVVLLNKITQKITDESLLHSLFPAGGLSGTLKNVYSTDDGHAFVWAKTGSVSNNYNQSGYLLTRKGRRLAFSFMNNNFMQPTAEVRAEMARIITFIHENF